MIEPIGGPFKLNAFQVETLSNVFKNNPYIESDMQVGFCSNGDASITAWDKDNPTHIFTINLPKIKKK